MDYVQPTARSYVRVPMARTSKRGTSLTMTISPPSARASNNRRAPLRSLLLGSMLSATVLTVGACKPDIPKLFKETVPAEHQDALTKVIDATDETKPDEPQLILWYEMAKVEKSALFTAFKKTTEAAGYGEMVRCEGDDVDQNVFVSVRAPNQGLTMSIRPLSDVFHVNLVLREAGTLNLPYDEECEFTEHAKKICVDISDKVCTLSKR